MRVKGAFPFIRRNPDTAGIDGSVRFFDGYATGRTCQILGRADLLSRIDDLQLLLIPTKMGQLDCA